jgi:hypothetical protein
MQRKKLLKFEDVSDRIHTLHDRNFKDQVVDLEKVRVVPDNNDKKPGVYLEVPNMGKLSLTDWSKRQLGSILGVKFDKWFDPAVVKAEEIQEELVRRFSRTHESRKVRARQYDPKDPGSKQSTTFGSSTGSASGSAGRWATWGSCRTTSAPTSSPTARATTPWSASR